MLTWKMCAALFIDTQLYLFIYSWWQDYYNLSSAGFYEIRFLYLLNKLEHHLNVFFLCTAQLHEIS